MPSTSNNVAVHPDTTHLNLDSGGTTLQRRPLLRVTDLVAGYGDLAAVRGMNLELYAGEVVALLGPNGAGKTTTLLTLAGELPKISGEIHYQGKPLKGPLHRRVRRGFAFVPEERAVFMGMSVSDNLKVGGHTDRVLALFPELTPLLNRRAGLLSGGEQQMVTVGRALALKPKVLLVDELSVGLAPLVVDRLLDAVRAAAQEDGTAVLLVEQQARRALRVADRWYLLRRGVLAGSGPADDTDALWESYVS
ncbi:MAG: amino acid/amide transporter rane protein 2, family / amino acid/amide transporter [Pseudonocardiales bacterium]|nr:amino acid/amide transporter rane protein 2, family / amino acid/amide transporter [Pseudonocardiales bacterium]